jgi:hypothetical protein
MVGRRLNTPEINNSVSASTIWCTIGVGSKLDADLQFGTPEHPNSFRTVSDIRRFLNALGRGVLLALTNPAEPMPAQEPERTAEAMRRALPELLKLDRYEQRACARRDRAVRALNQR